MSLCYQPYLAGCENEYIPQNALCVSGLEFGEVIESSDIFSIDIDHKSVATHIDYVMQTLLLIYCSDVYQSKEIECFLFTNKHQFLMV